MKGGGREEERGRGRVDMAKTKKMQRGFKAGCRGKKTREQQWSFEQGIKEEGVHLACGWQRLMAMA